MNSIEERNHYLWLVKVETRQRNIKFLRDLQKEKPPGGYVYFFHSEKTGLTKIGYSVNPLQRFTALSCSNNDLELWRVIQTKNARDGERTAHAAFREKRKTGEWFKISKTDAMGFSL